MLQRLFLLTFTFTIFISCKENTKSDSSINNDTSPNSQKSEVYCNVIFGSFKTKTGEYQFTSSNAMKKGTITTLFDIYPNEDIAEKVNLDISFMMNQKTTDPKLKKGSYDIKPLVSSDTSMASHFVMNTTIDENTYKNAVDGGFLEDIENDYMLLSENTNTLNIQSVKDVAGAPENSAFYEHGKQEVQGNATVYLLKVATKEKLKLTLNFNIYHDWTLSK